jgi:hypothetical protein
MTKEQLLYVASFMRRLEEDNTLQIKFKDLNSVYGMVYKGDNDTYLVVINSTLSYEKQLEVMWHEADHICYHFMNPGEVMTFEKEAIEFSKYAVKYTDEILPACRNAW